MTEFSSLLQSGNAWLFIPSAILLGALHGLEPGHSKTMMAAFIVAVQGTIGQAVMLGLAATVSHTALVWVVALDGMYFGSQADVQNVEPILQLVSGVIIVAVAVWMMWRTGREQSACGHDHGHGHDHHEHHDDRGDAHERAHAQHIQKQLADGKVTNGQILMFGLTGGLIPCPSSITVLLLCLQLKRVALGATLVLSFSIGLALTLVLSGVLAALSVKHVSSRWNGFGQWAGKAPYLSGALILLIGLYSAHLGAHALLSGVAPIHT